MESSTTHQIITIWSFDVARQRGFKPKSAKNKRALEALDQKAIEALVAAFPAGPGRFHQVTSHGQPETHWKPCVRFACALEWHKDCADMCPWGCCYCTCDCHDKE
jgi:hypothetical protein